MKPELSVVVPTHNRCELVLQCLESLSRQSLTPDRFEVIVVIDGSTDETAARVAQLDPPYRLHVVSQDASGLSAARNRGHRESSADLILCLDDDMVADRVLLEQHLEAHRCEQPRLVQGALRLHDSVHRSPFIRYQERLLSRQHEKYSRRQGPLGSEDVSGGNISVTRAALDSVGGFNRRLQGMRNTDGDLAHRLAARGVELHYAPMAAAAMTHINDLAASLSASEAYGRSYVFLTEQHPELIWKLSPLVQDRASRLRSAIRRVAFLAGDTRRRSAQRLIELGMRCTQALRLRAPSEALYRLAHDGRFWEGVHQQADGSIQSFIPQSVPILCYHNVSEVSRPAFRRYILPPERFARQIRWIVAQGYSVVSLDQLADYLERGAALPDKPIAITFDDGYRDLTETAIPLLTELGLHHTHFVNSRKLGGMTDWVVTAPDLPILSGTEIRALASRYPDLVDFQAHGRNHLYFPKQEAEELRDEIDGCFRDLQQHLDRPIRYLAYPFGGWNARIVKLVEELPIRNSFTVDQGLCSPAAMAQALPRIEIFTNDSFWGFRWKVKRGYNPSARLRRRIKRIAKRTLRRMRPAR